MASIRLIALADMELESGRCWTSTCPCRPGACLRLARLRHCWSYGLVVAADLRDAHTALGAITGQIVAEDLLDVIFAQFCIGK